MKFLSQIPGLAITRYECVHGGDINDCYCVHAGSEKYFLKVNDAIRFPGMFEKEANGLNALRGRSGLIIPVVIDQGVIDQKQFLLLEWLDHTETKSSHDFGEQLAILHKNSNEKFGFQEDNFIGSLEQINKFLPEWSDFYLENRIFPLTKQLFEKGSFSQKELRLLEKFAGRLKNFFPPEPPALLHGDLWSGNFMNVTGGKTALFDPAVYYGHREMDMGMTRLFGGFDPEFYAAYNEVYPLEPLWEQRLSLTQFYPLLVHAILFGGAYIEKCKDILKKWS